MKKFPRSAALLALLLGCLKPESEAFKTYKTFIEALAYRNHAVARMKISSEEMGEIVQNMEHDFGAQISRYGSCNGVSFDLKSETTTEEGDVLLDLEFTINWSKKGRHVYHHTARLTLMGEDWKIVDVQEHLK